MTHLYQLYRADGTPKSFNELADLFLTGVPLAARPFVHRLIQLGGDLHAKLLGSVPPILRTDSHFNKRPPPADWFAAAPVLPAPASPVHPQAPDLRWPKIWRTNPSNRVEEVERHPLSPATRLDRRLPKLVVKAILYADDTHWDPIALKAEASLSRAGAF